MLRRHFGVFQQTCRPTPTRSSAMFPRMRLSQATLFATIAITLLGTSSGCGPGATVIPTSYSTFVSKDRTFQCDAPEGWETTSGGSPGLIANASFKSGGSAIKITSDLAGSAMAGPMGPVNDPDPQFHPVEKLHGAGKAKMEE